MRVVSWSRSAIFAAPFDMSTLSSSSAATMTVHEPTRSVLDRAAGEARAHAARDVLGALAFDVLSRQAEGKVLFSGREFIDKRASEHGVTRNDAQTGAGNLLDILERGPEQGFERAMIAAFAVHGFGSRLLESSPEERSALVSRFVRHADFLELGTAYTMFPFVDSMLPLESAASLWQEVAQTIVDDASGAEAERARARNAARLSALAASSSDAARDALERVVESGAVDAPTRAFALALRGDSKLAPSRGVRIRGRVAPKRRSFAMRVLRWGTGWALLAWLARGIGALFGLRHELEVTLGGKQIDVREERFVLGRRIAESKSTLMPDAIVEAGRAARYPALRLTVGVAALSIGLLFGGLVMFDGARSGELSLMLAGAGLALAGALLDLAIDVLGPGRRARVSVEFSARSGRVFRIAKVPLEDADRFIDRVRLR